jgi:hypothetical protein
VRILKIKTPGEFVVFLIEGAAGSEDSYGHEIGDIALSALKLKSAERGARSGGGEGREQKGGKRRTSNAERPTSNSEGRQEDFMPMLMIESQTAEKAENAQQSNAQLRGETRTTDTEDLRVAPGKSWRIQDWLTDEPRWPF